jgi:PPOX class probable F420-dependent enzyme
MAAELAGEIRKALEERNFWHLATLNPDGSPQVTPVWVDLRGDRILVNSAHDRKKARNLAGEPRVALSWFDPESPYHSISIQGRVVDSYQGERAEADIDALAKKYLNEERYPYRRPEEARVSYLIEPTHVWNRAR